MRPSVAATDLVRLASASLLHRDHTLPRPQDYRIHAEAVPFNSTEGEGAVAILSVYPFGFEGPDRRSMAVPLGL